MRARGIAIAWTAAGLVTFGAAVALASKVESWKHESASAFNKGKRERLTVSDGGRVRLSRSLKSLPKFPASRVWDLALDRTGGLLAATGDEGKVYRLGKDAKDWTTALDSADSQILSLVALPDGRVFAGTGPSGSLVSVGAAKPETHRPDPKVQYIWDLASDAKGNVYAATGPTGQLWKRSTEGKWGLLLDSKHSHLLSVAVGKDGEVYAGSDGEGLIYKVAPGGKVSVLYDAPQGEIRTLHVAADGTLYAGTALESGGGGSGSSRGGGLFSGGGPSGVGVSYSNISTDVGVLGGARPMQREPGSRPSGGSSSSSGGSVPGGTAVPKPASAGENSVYRIGPDGVAREVFRSKVLIHSVLTVGDRLLIGTGPEGQLFEVRDSGSESAAIARLDSGQILAMLATPSGGVYLGAGDPGGVVELAPGHVLSGTLTSEVLDAKLPARFGSISWKADTPKGSAVALQVRTGNVNEPDATWTEWSPEQADAASAQAIVEPGRFAQFRLTLRTSDPGVSPELRGLTLRYQTTNLAPEIAKVEVPDITSGDGGSKQSKLTIKWDASDPNGDELIYRIQIRKEGWPDWVKLVDSPITESSYGWDTTTFPDGNYRVRILASDRPSNRPEDAIERERVSESFLVDHQAPAVSITVPEGKQVANLTAKDERTRLVKASYAIDGGEWVNIFPDDRLFDANIEVLSIPLREVGSGTHVIVVRVTDAAGNVGAGDAVFKVP